MGTSSKIRQAEFRDRMKKEGFKEKRIWVPVESESKAIQLTRLTFLKRIEELTLGWSKAKQSRLFNDVLGILRRRIKQEDK